MQLQSALSFFWLSIVYGCTTVKHLFFIIFILSYLAIIDNIFMLLFPASTGGFQFALKNPYAYFSICCCAKAAELLGIILIYIIRQKQLIVTTLSWKEWFGVGFFPLSTLIISCMMSRILYFDLKYAQVIAPCMFVMLFSDIFSIYFLKYIDNSHRAILENTILRQNLKLESEHISSLQDNYEQQRKQTHEFYNQLATLQGLAAKKVPFEEVSKYLGTLLATKPPVAFYINTHRTVVDVILSQRVPFARDNGIDFQLQLEDLSRFPLPDDALVVVLTNLIDNAIEACEKIPLGQERLIRLTMKTEGATAWLCIENTTAAPVSIRNNFVLTTKGDPLLHGYGLKNISTLIKKNNGTYILDYRADDARFGFYAKFPFSK